MRFLAKIVGVTLLGLFLFLLCALATLVIYYSNLPGPFLRMIAAGAFALGTLAAFLIFPNRRRTTFLFLGAFGMVVVWWSLIPASNDRDWVPEVAVLARATFNDNLVTVRNIRNFDYSTENDFTIRYYDKTYERTRAKQATPAWRCCQRPWHCGPVLSRVPRVQPGQPTAGHVPVWRAQSAVGPRRWSACL